MRGKKIWRCDSGGGAAAPAAVAATAVQEDENIFYELLGDDKTLY